MYRPLIFSAALIAAAGTTSWSQTNVDVPASTGTSPATANVDVNLGIPNSNTPNVPGTSLPTQAAGVNVNTPNTNVRANLQPRTANQPTNTQADVTAQGIRVQGSAATAGNVAPRANVGVDSNDNGRRDALDRREERREDRRDGVVGDDNRRIGVDDRAATNDNGNKWRYKYHNNHWWYYQPDNSWVIYHNNGWVPYSAATYSTYYPSRRTTTSYQPSYNSGYVQRGPQPYSSYYRGGPGYNQGYNNQGYYNQGYGPGYNNGYYGNRDLRYSDGSPGGNIGATIGGSIGRDAGGRQGGNIGAAIGGAIGSGR